MICSSASDESDGAGSSRRACGLKTHRALPVASGGAQFGPLPVARGYLDVTVLNSKLYAIGGYDGSTFYDSLTSYDPTTSVWTDLPAMSTTRRRLGVGSAWGLILAAGGTTAGPTTLGTLEIYDPTTSAWSDGPSMPAERSHFAATAQFIGSALYVVGGRVSACAASRFDFFWHNEQVSARPRRMLTATHSRR